MALALAVGRAGDPAGAPGVRAPRQRRHPPDGGLAVGRQWAPAAVLGRGGEMLVCSHLPEPLFCVIWLSFGTGSGGTRSYYFVSKQGSKTERGHIIADYTLPCALNA